jgi:hypothetical chaperone protein
LRGIGIDFGTTNSVIAVADDSGRVRAMRWPSASGPQDVYRTALAFRSLATEGTRRTVTAAGPEAIAWALDPAPHQRFVQSIKTHLGSAAFGEMRVFGERLTLDGLIARFLGHLTGEGAPEESGSPDWTAPLAAGRPVVFAGDRPDEDLAVSRLRAAYAAAGFADPELVYEPLGAAYWYARDLARPETVLVADFGGGTSDFSVMRFDRRDGRLLAEALAHDGVGVAGDTFDYRIIDHVVSPRLGKQARYRSFTKWLPVPQRFFTAFARWHQLSWLKDPKVLADLDAIAETADDPDGLAALRTMIDHDLGLDLYAAVTETKTRLSAETAAPFRFDRYGVTLDAMVSRADFEAWIAEDIAAIGRAMDGALAKAGLRDTDIDAIFMTGGTSHVPAVRGLFVERFGPDRIHVGNAFQSVASGLALAARDKALQAV